TQGLLEKGIISQNELDEKITFFRENPEAKPPVVYDKTKFKQAMADMFNQQEPDPEQEGPPLFKVGQVVCVKNMHPIGHTRLPRYCRGKQGVIEKCYGYWRVDDTPPAGEKHAIEPLYRVKFEGRELWGAEAEANQVLYIDMFENYLENNM
ncbi:MAG: hypothetical protein ACI9EW_002570, partial [Cellvibrionaceae bacterium]